MGRFWHKAAVLAGIATRRYAFTGPMFARVNLTYACNLHCSFCRYHSPEAADPRYRPAGGPAHLDLELVTGAFDDLRAMGTRSLVFSGEGEPLLYPHFAETIQYAKRLGMICTVVTNGTLLTDDVARQLVELGVQRLTVSITAGTREHYATLHGMGGVDGWDAICEGVRAVVRHRQSRGTRRPDVSLQHILTTQSGPEVAQMLENTAALGADNAVFVPMIPYTEGMKPLTPAGEEQRSIIAALRAAKGRAAELGVAANLDGVVRRFEIGPDSYLRMRCYAGWLVTRITHEGDVMPCYGLPWKAGNLHEQSLRDIWRSERYREFRRVASRVGGANDPRFGVHCPYCSYHSLHEGVEKYLHPPGLLAGLLSRRRSRSGPGGQ